MELLGSLSISSSFSKNKKMVFIFFFLLNLHALKPRRLGLNRPFYFIDLPSKK